MKRGDSICAINLLTLREGASIEAFGRFSAELDQPTVRALDVVEGFDVYAVTRRSPGTPKIDIVEVMQVRSSEEWEETISELEVLEQVTDAFDELVDGDEVYTLFGTPIPSRAPKSG